MIPSRGMIGALTVLIVLTVGCNRTSTELGEVSSGTGIGSAGADEATDTLRSTSSDGEVEDPIWTDAEQEAIEWFGLERARPTLLQARDFAAGCPDGDFAVFPEPDELFGAGSQAAPEIDGSSDLAYIDVLVRTTPTEVVPLALYDDEPPVPTLRATVTEVLWTGPAHPDDAVAVGDTVEAVINWHQPCPVPATAVVGLGAYRYDDGSVELSTQLVADAEGRPTPAARWLTAAAVRDYADFHDRPPDIDLLVELIEAADGLQATIADQGCWPEEGTCPPTPGPYGEWRVARGHERDPAAPPIEEERRDAALAAWLDTPWEERPLSDVLEDLPEGADEALGITWAWREAQLSSDEAAELGVSWLGLRWPDVGVLCCFNVETPGPQGVFGFGAEDGPVELLGMSGDDPDPTTATVLRRWEQWPGGEFVSLRIEDGQIVGP